MYDLHWLKGESIYYIAKIDTFSSAGLKYLLDDNMWLSKLLTYAVLFYQGSFAIIVWIKRIKIPFLILGMIIHISISIGMGIFAFGIFMSISYLLFLEPHQINRLKKMLKFKKIIKQ